MLLTVSRFASVVTIFVFHASRDKHVKPPVFDDAHRVVPGCDPPLPPPLPALCSLSRSKSILYMSVLHNMMIFRAFVKNTCKYVKRGKPTIGWKSNLKENIV